MHIRVMTLSLVVAALASLVWIASVSAFDFPQCTLESNCSSHALFVSNATLDSSVCNCTCFENFSGSSCDACAAGYNQSTYPVCSENDRPCTVHQDCNANFSRSVSGTTATGCQCSCIGRAVGPRCECPARFDQDPRTRCSQCAFGFNQSTFPDCLRLCNLTADCPPRSVSVTGNLDTGCTCKCLGGWAAPNCSVCPSNWDSSSGCVICAQGYSHINSSCILCGTQDCSFHGTAQPTATSCGCQCRNHWSGAICNMCPVQYDNSEDGDCWQCNTALGFVGTNGVCTPLCTSANNCSSHSTDPVFLNSSSSKCECVCQNKWNGTACETCPYPYDASKSCNDCLPGLVNFPECTNATTTTTTPPTTTTAPETTTTPNTTTMPPTSTTAPPTTTVAPPTLPPQKRNTSTHSISFHLSATLRLFPTRSTSVSVNVSHSQTLSLSPTSAASLSSTLSATLSRQTHTRNGSASASQSPSATLTRTASVSVSFTRTTLSDSVSVSLCANTIEDCTFRTNNSLVDRRPSRCFCSCRNQWSEMFCNHCSFRYNATADCGACFNGAVPLEPKFVIYPQCDYILYILGNLTVPLADSSLEHALVRSSYFAAIAADVTYFFNTTLSCASNASNITAYVIRWDGGNKFVVDVEILNQDVQRTQFAAACVLGGFRTQLSRLSFSNAAAVATQIGGTGNRGSFFDLALTTVQLEHGAATQLNPCDPLWCATIPPIVDTVEIVKDWTGLIIAAAVIGSLLLVAAAAYFAWYRPRQQFLQEYRYYRGADAEFRRIRDLSGLEMEWCTPSSSSMHVELMNSEPNGSTSLRFGSPAPATATKSVEDVKPDAASLAASKPAGNEVTPVVATVDHDSPPNPDPIQAVTATL